MLKHKVLNIFTNSCFISFHVNLILLLLALHHLPRKSKQIVLTFWYSYGVGYGVGYGLGGVGYGLGGVGYGLGGVGYGLGGVGYGIGAAPVAYAVRPALGLWGSGAGGAAGAAGAGAAVKK